jgi:trk system potassium uptake protein TrkH
MSYVVDQAKPSNFERFERFIEQKNFWTSNRFLFIFSLVLHLLCAIGLSFTEYGNFSLKFNTFWDHLFNSISIGTLTGLIRGDVGNYTFWGQFLLILNMFLNAIITSIIGILVFLLIRFGFDKKIKLYDELHKMRVDSFDVIAFIFVDIFILWVLGAVVMWWAGTNSIWEAVFNSLSHVINAGITSLEGGMYRYRNNDLMLITGIVLITIGGLGISIRALLYKWLLNLVGLKNLAKHIPSSVVAPLNFTLTILFITIVLQIIGAISIHFFESVNSQTLGSGDYLNTELNAYFLSVSSRTAGFSTISDLSKLNDKTSFLLMGLMVIGASSGSFTGGVFKLTAFLYILVYLYTFLKGNFRKGIKNGFIHFSEKTAGESNFRIIAFTLATLLIVSFTFFTQPNVSGFWLFFEGISAVSNTGLTMGAVNLLNYPTMLLMILLMILGKIGFLSFSSLSKKFDTLLSKKTTDYEAFSVD